MVQVGKFHAEIICGDTKNPFPEHTAPNGEVYVEVEPDSEYWIRIWTDSEDLVRVDASVDGNSLGYYFVTSKHDTVKDRGLSKRENGKSYTYALKFAKATVRDGTNAGGAAPAQFWTGKIEVSFSEALFQGHSYARDYSNRWTGGDVSYVMGISDPDKKKGVKSDMGSSFEVTKCGHGQVADYAKGGLLKTITLRYCSTLGLIHAGILPKPPMWDFHRLTNPADGSQENVPEPNATVKGENGEKSELFDLSA